MEHHLQTLEREIPLSWKKTRAKAVVYLPYSGFHSLTVTLRQDKAKDEYRGGSSDIVCLHQRDIEILSKFVDDVVAEAKGVYLAVC